MNVPREPKLSVIIVVFNEHRIVGELLRRVLSVAIA